MDSETLFKAQDLYSEIYNTERMIKKINSSVYITFGPHTVDNNSVRLTNEDYPNLMNTLKEVAKDYLNERIELKRKMFEDL